MFSMCFLEEVPDYDLPMDLGDDTDVVTLLDIYMDEMDMMALAVSLTQPRVGPIMLLTYWEFL